MTCPPITDPFTRSILARVKEELIGQNRQFLPQDRPFDPDHPEDDPHFEEVAREITLDMMVALSERVQLALEGGN